MSGTKAGGRKAAETNKLKHGEDFYKRIGSKGGKKSTTGGFFANRELAVIAGRKGGKISRRGKQKAPKKPRYKGDKIKNIKTLLVVLRNLNQNEDN